MRAISVAAVAALAAAPAAPDARALRIAFGSCSEHDQPQPIWDEVLGTEPDVFVWVGDAVYGDTTNPSVLREKYAAQLAQPGYARLRARVPLLGTWDDHDYGVNVGNRNYPMRAESQQAFLDFLGLPPGDARRAQAGVYSAHELRAGELRVRLVLLDVRYHREPAERPEAEMLGAAQWRWLEAQLAPGAADLAVVFSGTQVLPDEHLAEKWADYPAEQQRLYRTLGTAPFPVLLASGDRHFGELSCDSWTPAARPLYEIMSSGLNRHGDASEDRNRRRIGEAWSGFNFGLIEVDAAAGRVSLEIRDVEGRVRVEKALALDALRPRSLPKRILQWGASGGCGADSDLPGPLAGLGPGLLLVAFGAALAIPLLRRRVR